MTENTWKLHDAKSRFSEVVRRARAGEPQKVTVHGKDPVLVVDPARFEVRARETEPKQRTMAEFIERSKKYRGAPLKLPRRVKMKFTTRPVFGDN
jgi:prevent-host-death family protein